MIRNAKHLSPVEKAAIETLLGRQLLENEEISVRTLEFTASGTKVSGEGTQEGANSAAMAREEAVRRMLEFGEKYRLSLGEPVTHRFLHEGHRI